MNKRLFIGIKIDASDKLIILMNELQSSLNRSDIKWVDLKKLHITLMFLGDTDSEKIPILIEELRKMCLDYKPFQLSIKGLGRFAKKQHTNVIWAGIDDDGSLHRFASQANHQLRFYRAKTDLFSFNPHLTLGRVKSNCNELVLTELINSYRKFMLQEVFVTRIALFESKLNPAGDVYSELSGNELEPY